MDSQEYKDSTKDIILSPPPPDVVERIDRGKRQIKEQSGLRNECLALYRGDHYQFQPASLVSSSGSLQDVSRLIGPSAGVEPYRAKAVRNFIPDFVRREVSIATTRTPVFDVLPTGTDRKKIEAANIAEKVALYGYDKWNTREIAVRVSTLAVITGEGFAWPYFDNSIGPYLNDEGVGVGEIRIRVLHGNQVGWQPGMTFSESRWYIVEHVRPIDEVKKMSNFVGGDLQPDASTSTLLNTPQDENSNLILVTEYVERPCPKYPNGRRLTIANNRLLVPERPYPLVGKDNKVIDEPFLVRLIKDVDPENDRPRGMVADLIGPQRAINDLESRKLEAKNLGLLPMMVTKNLKPSIPAIKPIPGAIYNLQGQGEIGWVPPIPPQIITQINDMKMATLDDMGRIVAQNDPPKNIESSKALQVYNERDVSARAVFLSNVAEFYGTLMQRCLVLVQRHYDEPRVIRINGINGSESIDNFTGAQLVDEIDVRVSPASIEPRTREGVSAVVNQLIQMGKVDLQKGLQAIQLGSLEKLTESYDKDVARANRVIQSLKEGPEVFLQGNDMPDGTPSFMPRKFDNVTIHKQVFEDWMKTVDFEQSEQAIQEAALLYYDGLTQLEQQRQAEEQQQQMQMAQGLGMANAAKPSMAGTPSLPQQ